MNKITKKIVCLTIGIVAFFLARSIQPRIDDVCDENSTNMQLILSEFDYWEHSFPALTEKEIHQIEQSNSAIDQAAFDISDGKVEKGLNRITNAELDYIQSGGPLEDAKRSYESMSSFRFWPLDAMAGSDWASWVAKCTIPVLSAWVLVVTSIVAFFVEDVSEQSTYEILGGLGFFISIPFGFCLGLIFSGGSSVPVQMIAIPIGVFAVAIAFSACVAAFYGVGQVD